MVLDPKFFLIISFSLWLESDFYNPIQLEAVGDEGE
jgi:hypothetical protein